MVARRVPLSGDPWEQSRRSSRAWIRRTEGAEAPSVPLGSGIIWRRRARLTMSLANGVVPRWSGMGRQARNHDPGVSQAPLLQCVGVSPRRESRSRRGDQTTHSRVLVPTFERSSNSADPEGLHRHEGEEANIPRVPESFVVCRWKRRASCRLPIAVGQRPAPRETTFASKALGGTSIGVARAHEGVSVLNQRCLRGVRPNRN